jgi:hypothetical protein
VKDKDLLKRLREIEKLKSGIKYRVQEAFDMIHRLETEIALLIEAIQEEKKRK